MADQKTPILTGQRLGMFVSHKSEDVEIARDIKRWIAQYYGEQASVFLSEDLPYGDDWRPELDRELAKADMLVLLYTDPFQDWNWCIYESGYFRGAHARSSKPLIVLHDEKITRPTPLGFLQTVELSETNGALHRWLASELPNRKAPWQPIRQAEPPADDFVPFAELEKRILKSLCGSGAPKVFSKEIRLEIPEAALQSVPRSRMSDEVVVFGTTDSLHELFELQPEPKGYRWTEFYPFLDRMSGNTQEWVASLCNLMHTIAFEPRMLSSSGLPLYRSQRAGSEPRFYRPMIRGFRKIKGVLSYEILFADLPREATVEPNEAVGWLAHALTISRMLYWGALWPLAQTLKDLSAERSPDDAALRKRNAEAKQALGGLFASFVTIYVEANNRGYNRERIFSCLAGEDYKYFEGIVKQWDCLREELKEAYDEIDRTPEGLAKARKLVRKGLEINKRSMILFARRYHECLQQLPDEP